MNRVVTTSTGIVLSGPGDRQAVYDALVGRLTRTHAVEMPLPDRTPWPTLPPTGVALVRLMPSGYTRNILLP